MNGLHTHGWKLLNLGQPACSCCMNYLEVSSLQLVYVHTHTHIYIYTYIYMYTCVCVCVCVWNRCIRLFYVCLRCRRFLLPCELAWARLGATVQHLGVAPSCIKSSRTALAVDVLDGIDTSECMQKPSSARPGQQLKPNRDPSGLDAYSVKTWALTSCHSPAHTKESVPRIDPIRQ